MTTDKITTIISTIKALVGLITATSLTFGKPLGEGTQNLITLIGVLLYLGFSWYQGYWTNKEIEKVSDSKGDAISGTIYEGVDVDDNSISYSIRETYAVNKRADEARLKEGREYLDPCETLLSQRRSI